MNSGVDWLAWVGACFLLLVICTATVHRQKQHERNETDVQIKSKALQTANATNAGLVMPIMNRAADD